MVPYTVKVLSKSNPLKLENSAYTVVEPCACCDWPIFYCHVLCEGGNSSAIEHSSGK